MWDKLGEYVKLAVRLLMALATKLAAIVKSISSIGDFVTKLVDTIALMASFEDELRDIASTLRKAAPSIKTLWPHGSKELSDTALGLEALAALLVALDVAAKDPTEETLAAVEAASKNPDLKQLIPS